ncbi:helix-turn-helix domain-containing protein [Spongiimicrobium salis]|uniref:helix-turn-helix domain-containing protein n=1 Tax=Spongiimicrobium salis TaxID=1667022 RepID=UPI00374C9AC2
MEIITLPNDLKIAASSFQVYDYRTSTSCFRQMVSLKQNTFSFLMEGNKEVFSDKTSTAIEASSFLLMKTGHCLMTEKLSNTQNNYRSILFFFSNEAVFDFIQKHKIRATDDPVRESIHRFQYDNFLRRFVQGLIDISTLDPTLQTKLLALKFEELPLYLQEVKGVDFVFSLISDIDNKSQHFIEVVETNTLNKLTLKELAFLSNMSVSTFKREFKKHFNTPPIRWFQEKRLEHSAFLLKSKSIRPSDIFEETGYENLSNFIQAFKAKFGVTPKQYQTN